MSKKEMNMNIEERKQSIVHKFMQFTPKEQQLVLDKIKEIVSNIN